jgi:cyanophycinase
VDGSHVTHSNVAEAQPERTLSMHDVRLHVLSSGDAFDLEARRPIVASANRKNASDARR